MEHLTLEEFLDQFTTDGVPSEYSKQTNTKFRKLKPETRKEIYKLLNNDRNFVMELLFDQIEKSIKYYNRSKEMDKTISILSVKLVNMEYTD